MIQPMTFRKTHGANGRRCYLVHSRLLLRAGVALSAAMAAFSLPACNEDPAASQISDLRTEIQRRDDAQRLLALQLTDANAVIEKQKQQILSLQAKGGAQRADQLVTVTGIALAPLTGGFDDDGKAGDDGIVAYLQPLDSDGDVIKAAGDIRVQVFDLANPPAEQLVAGGEWTAAEARKAWYGKLMTTHYTLRCPWKNGRRPAHTTLTVRVVFVELLTGKGFETQRVVEARLAP